MPRRRKDSTESFAAWMARVDRQVENATRRIKTGPRTPARSLIQNANMPLVVFEGAMLAPELREKLARLTALSQKSVIAWAELRQQRDRWRKLRDELIRIDEWLRDEYAHICRELNPEEGL
jgi:transposase